MPKRKDLTVVLTLKDRSAFTYRWMHWMSRQNFPYKIIIADGGADKIVESHLSNKANYPNLDYEYIRYQYDEDISKYLEKLADVSSKIDTPFVLAADNDDLIMLRPLEENLEIIRADDDIHGVCPANYRFKIHRNTDDIDDLVYAGDVPISFTRIPGISLPHLQDSNACKRLMAVVEKFCSNFMYYGIHRTKNYKSINCNLYDMKINRFLLLEMYNTYAYAVSGKNIIDKTHPFLLRQDGTSQCAATIADIESHSNLIFYRDWSGSLYAIIDRLFQQCKDMGCEMDREQFEESFRTALRKDFLAWTEFRGVANKMKKYSLLYKFGRIVFSFYRGYKPYNVSSREIRSNKDLYKVYNFLNSPDVSNRIYVTK